jgi:hypothetical protein
MAKGLSQRMLVKEQNVFCKRISNNPLKNQEDYMQ